MFSNGANKRLEVTIKMIDGSIVSGGIPAGLSAGLFAALNKAQPFIEIVESSGQRRCLGQAHIVSIEEQKPFEVPQAPVVKNANVANAFEILGLKPGCSAQEAQQRYHAMVKQYHPDKYQSVQLPDEMKTYLAAMFQQIGTAHQIVTQEISKQQAA